MPQLENHHERPELYSDAPSIIIDTLEVELLAERLIRKHILVQHVESDHPVLKNEERLVGDSTLCVIDHVNDLTRDLDRKGLPVKYVRPFVLNRLKGAIRVLIRLHDLENSFAEEVVLGAEAEAAIILLPSNH
jgi:hypothetical protein